MTSSPHISPSTQARFIHEALWIGPLPFAEEEREKLDIAHEYVDGLVEQLETYEAALTRIAARGAGRRVHTGELTCVMIATSALDHEPYPAKEPS